MNDLFARSRRFTLLDGVLLVLLIGAAVYVVHRITVQLHYDWNWAAIPQFLFRRDEATGHWVANYLTHGLLTTVRLSLWSGVLALCLGLVLALARTGRNLYGRLVARTAIELLRNLPPLVTIFLGYFFLADQLIPLFNLNVAVAEAEPSVRRLIGALVAPPEQVSAFAAAALTLAVIESTYVAEILRAGIESVGRPQWEAGLALGLTRRQCLRYVILPQAFDRVLPPLAGQMISLIKDSAIVSVISIQELTYQGTQLMASTSMTIEVWLTIAVLYFLLTFPCSLVVDRLGRRRRSA